MTQAAERRQMRRHFRAMRRALAPAQQESHARRASRILVTSGLLLSKRRVSAYFAVDGELDPESLVAHMHQTRIEVYFPVIGRRRAMTFCRLKPGDKLELNRVGIWEPVGSRAPTAPAWSLSMMLVPLVAFDSRGTRLGMGGGFYDAYLAKLGKQRPLLVGFAHECQAAEDIPRQPWDIPLDAVVTEESLRAFSDRARALTAFNRSR